MKQVTVTRDVYTITELSDTAQQRALEKVRDDLYKWIETDQITEYLNGEAILMLTGEFVGEVMNDELLKRVGLTIWWALSYSQGDGVSMSGTIYATDTPALTWGNATYATLTHAGRYYHENSFTVSLYETDSEGYEVDYDTATTDIFAEQLRDICRQLQRCGYQQLDSLTSEQAAIDHLEANEQRRFDIDGNYVPIEFWTDNNTYAVSEITQ